MDCNVRGRPCDGHDDRRKARDVFAMQRRMHGAEPSNCIFTELCRHAHRGQPDSRFIFFPMHCLRPVHSREQNSPDPIEAGGPGNAGSSGCSATAFLYSSRSALWIQFRIWITPDKHAGRKRMDPAESRINEGGRKRARNDVPERKSPDLQPRERSGERVGCPTCGTASCRRSRAWWRSSRPSPGAAERTSRSCRHSRPPG
jgi:hypothetical protein